MGNLADREGIGGETVRISDCHVWAEIYYLDSPTDYREYLPQKCAHPSAVPACQPKLESCGRGSAALGSPLWLAALLVLLSIFFALYLVGVW
jgi:hypothetical protein